MSSPERTGPDIPDFVRLASASMRELVAELRRAAVAGTGATGWGSLPPLVSQLADLVLAEAIRLIRLGTRVEQTDAAVELSELMITPAARTLKERHPGAHAVLIAASTALSASLSPASRGGELTVLRSWNGKALELVAHVSRAERQAVPRTELKRLLGLEDSNLSHLLGDLEAAGLIERIRDGRHVTVHLGSRAEEERVRTLIDELDDPAAVDAPELVKAAVLRIRDEVAQNVFHRSSDTTALRELRDKLSKLAERTETWDARPAATIADGDLVDCHVLITATLGETDDELSCELICSARVEDGHIISARLRWGSDAEWLVRPPHHTVVDLGVTRGVFTGEVSEYAIDENTIVNTIIHPKRPALWGTLPFVLDEESGDGSIEQMRPPRPPLTGMMRPYIVDIGYQQRRSIFGRDELEAAAALTLIGDESTN